MSLSLCRCSLTVSELQFGSFVCSSLKRLSSCLFSEVSLPLFNSTILSGRTGRYEELTIGCLSHWCHLKHQGCVHWPGFYTREGFSFPSISVISSSTSVHSIAPPPVYFRLAYLALVADNKLYHFFLSFSLVLWGNPAATNWLRTSNHVCIFNINVSVGDKVPNRVIFLFLT